MPYHFRLAMYTSCMCEFFFHFSSSQIYILSLPYRKNQDVTGSFLLATSKLIFSKILLLHYYTTRLKVIWVGCNPKHSMSLI